MLLSSIKEINSINASKFVMVTLQFGEPVYIGLLKDGQPTVEEEIEKAEQWDFADTLCDYKLAYAQSITGYTGLKWEAIK